MEILVVFKTHLDLGYTDLAANIEKNISLTRSTLRKK